VPHFKTYDYNQMKMLPISFDKQILPGSFECSLSYLIDHEIDQSIFYHRYINDENGAPAYDPAILLRNNGRPRNFMADPVIFVIPVYFSVCYIYGLCLLGHCGSRTAMLNKSSVVNTNETKH
jgi:hypothetical protein